MTTLRLTAQFVETLKAGPKRREYFDTVAPGLVLRIAPSGRKTWCYIYRPQKVRTLRRLTFGTAPPMTLKKARQRAIAERKAVEVEGKDPARQKAASKHVDSFADLTDWYLKEYAQKSKRSWAEDDRIIRKELLPHWRDRKANEITRAEVRALLERIAKRPAPVMANRVLALVSRLYVKALEHDLAGITGNPALRLPKPGGAEAARERVLDDDELRQLWAVLEDLTALKRHGDAPPPISPMIARGLQVVLLTGQRPGEVFRMRWEDLELPDDWQTAQGPIAGAWWTLPATLTKNKVVHRVPLTAGVVDVLKAAKSQVAGAAPCPWVFAGEKGGSVAERASKAPSELARAKRPDGEPLLPFRFHRHDLRRTCATNLGKIGIPRETISRVLNHVDRGARATAVYQRYEFDAEKRAALEAWERRLTAILTTKPAEVLTFARRPQPVTSAS